MEAQEVTAKRLKLELRLEQLKKIDYSKNNFLYFVKQMWPEFIAGAHHKIIADKLEINTHPRDVIIALCNS